MTFNILKNLKKKPQTQKAIITLNTLEMQYSRALFAWTSVEVNTEIPCTFTTLQIRGWTAAHCMPVFPEGKWNMTSGRRSTFFSLEILKYLMLNYSWTFENQFSILEFWFNLNNLIKQYTDPLFYNPIIQQKINQTSLLEK